MSAAFAAVLMPFFAALGLGFLGSPRVGAWINLVASAVLFLLTLAVADSPGAGLIRADHLGLIFGVLTGFVGLTAAINNIGFVRGQALLMSARCWRVYHAMSQVSLGAILLGLYADNIGLLWLGVAVAAMAAGVGLSLPRGAFLLTAAGEYFSLAGAGIALVLFGIMVTYSAAQPAVGPGLPALSFAALAANAAHLNGALMTVALVFLLFGFGASAAMLCAYAQAPAPLTATLAGLSLNVPLLAILRFRHVLDVNMAAGGGAMRPGAFLLLLGLAALFLAAFLLWRRRDVTRYFGAALIQYAGVVIFASGIGGKVIVFGGLLYMILQTLVISALFQALTKTSVALPARSKQPGWLFWGCIFASTGLPPSGVFTANYLIISQTMLRAPWLSLPLGVGILLCGVAMIRRINPLALVPPPGREMLTIYAHLIAVFIIGFAMPGALVALLSDVAQGLQ